jgi:hypothetical protein
MRQWEIQKSIYQTLTADPDLMEVITGVFDHVPQGQDYPYINIGEDTSIEWDTDTELGSESTLTVHVWSREYGRRQVKEIMEQIYDILHRAEIELETLHLVDCVVEFMETFLESDGVTRHGVMRIRVTTQEG